MIAQLATQLESCRTVRLDLWRRAIQNANRPPATRDPIVDQIENRITRERRSRNGDIKNARISFCKSPPHPGTSVAVLAFVSKEQPIPCNQEIDRCTAVRAGVELPTKQERSLLHRSSRRERSRTPVRAVRPGRGLKKASQRQQADAASCAHVAWAERKTSRKQLRILRSSR